MNVSSISAIPVGLDGRLRSQQPVAQAKSRIAKNAGLAGYSTHSFAVDQHLSEYVLGISR
ncbi:hypothetical protein [Salinisphaera sp. T31B1]|uniref:hypothetical protein n=1 Tax=Salinisphaera sp. T31B1 TaxID=727963 RepID=UPI00334209D8